MSLKLHTSVNEAPFEGKKERKKIVHLSDDYELY